MKHQSHHNISGVAIPAAAASFNNRSCNMNRNNVRATRQLGIDQQIEAAERQINQNAEKQWRKYGRARREEILKHDEEHGGTSFHLNAQCSIIRYFQVSSRALQQFHTMYREKADLEETYIMGHRMKVFLLDCLPEHPDYMSDEVNEERERSLRELVVVLECLDDIALKIDEEQLNQYITDDFDPIPDDSSTDSLDDQSSQQNDSFVPKSFEEGWAKPESWEAFTGWGHEFRLDAPTVSTEATSGTDSDNGCALPHIELCNKPQNRVKFRDLVKHLEFDEYDEGEELDLSLASMNDDDDDVIHGEDYLRQIAHEDFCYETDSEAVDSWAQGDGDSSSFAPSACSSNGLKCDPARILLRDILGRFPRAPTSPVLEEDGNGSSMGSFHDSESQSRDPASPLRPSYPEIDCSRSSFMEKGNNNRFMSFKDNSEPEYDEWIDFDTGDIPMKSRARIGYVENQTAMI